MQPDTFWKNYGPTTVLLLIITTAAVGILIKGTPDVTGAPSLNITNVLLLIAVGFLAGGLGGLIGTGGCSVMLPILHFWMGFSAPLAIGTTLFAVIFTAISGGYTHLVRRNLDIRATAWLGGFGIIGVLIGSFLFSMLADQSRLLGLILGLVFIWPAFRMIWEGLFSARQGIQIEGNSINANAGGLAVFGSIVGILTGLVGLGGGYALVPGLIYLFRAPVYITMGTSLATIIPMAIIGGSIKLVEGFVVLGAALFLAAGTIAGAQLGATFIKRFKPSTLKLIFGIYFLYVAVKFIGNYLGLPVW